MSQPKGNFRNQKHTINRLNYKIVGVKHEKKIAASPNCIEAYI